MAPPRDQVFLLDFERSEEVQPLRVVHHGLAYMGEAIAARHWDPSWGRPLEGDSYFRVVVLMEPATVRPEGVQDSRIAVCVPGRRRSARAWERSARELATLREARTLYQTGRGQAGGPIDGFLEEEQERLQDLVAEEEAGRYRAGYLQSPTVFSEDLDKIFEGPYPSAWVRRVAEALLLWAYPSLPLDPSLFPRALEPWDPGSIFEALFADHPGSKTALGQFGPGLGLSAPADPLSFDSEGTQGECRVFGHIREALEQRQGELPWTEIHYLLAHSIGLTQPLATLYLLTFVHHGAPPTELSLSVGQEHALRGRRLVRGAKLTREFVPIIPWEPGSWGNDPPMFPRFLSLRYPKEEVTWNDALLYTSLLCPGLEEAGEESSYSVQERRLVDAIGGLAADAERAAGVLRYLSMAIPSPNEDELRSALRRTSAVCQGQDYHQIYLLLRATYSDPRVLFG